MENELNRILESDDSESPEKIRETLDLKKAVLKTVAELIEFRDGSTGGHIERTQLYLGVLLGAMIEKKIYADKIDKWNLWVFLNSAQLHDVGKIAVRDSILQKAGKLTDEEFEEIKEHAVFGEKIIDKIKEHAKNSEFLEHARVLAGTHHEKWDGSGYPRGLKGEDIPLEGRLMAIADVYDALVSERSYKLAVSHEEAAAVIACGKGTHFDPVLVDVFLEKADAFKKIAANF